MSGKPVLLYFPFPGRANPARVALFNSLGQDGWVDDTIDFPTFTAEKAKWQAENDKAVAEGRKADYTGCKLQSDMGYVPQLTIPGAGPNGSDLVVTQGVAIAKWCAKQGSKLTTTDPIKDLLIDEHIELSSEILNKCPHDKDEAVKKSLREAYAAGPMKKGMRGICYKMDKSGYCVGDSLTLADLFLQSVYHMVRSGMFDYVPSEYIDSFPEIVKHEEVMKNDPIMKAYNEKYKW